MESNSNKYIQLIGGFIAIVFGVLQGIDWLFKKYEINSFYFNIYEISSWSRGTVVPLSLVRSLEPVHSLPPDRDVQELFTENDRDLDFKPSGLPFTSWRNTFIYLDRIIKLISTNSDGF